MSTWHSVTGYIYFMAVPPNLVKIGFSRDPKLRKKDLNKRSPETALTRLGVLLHTWPEATISIEKELHAMLQAFVEPGFNEWYRDTPEFRAAFIATGLDIDPRPYEWDDYRRTIRDLTDKLLAINGYAPTSPTKAQSSAL